MGQYFIPISNLVAHCREPENIFDALILPKLVGEYLNLPHIDEVINLWFWLQRLIPFKRSTVYQKRQLYCVFSCLWWISDEEYLVTFY